MSWSDAAAFANAVGGHLATVTELAESTFLMERVINYLPDDPMQAPPWLGAYQDSNAPDYGEPDGGWVWVTGEPFVFTNWADGQPDDLYCDGTSGLNEDVLALTRGEFGLEMTWNDFPDIAIDMCDGEERMVAGYLLEWSADCTNDGIVDYQQIMDGELADENGNGIPDVCEDATLDVPDEFPTIALAIEAAADGDLILVAPGVYNEAIDFQGKAVRVEAMTGFGETIIDGTGLTSAIVTMMNGEDENSVLRGFTLANGTAGFAVSGQSEQDGRWRALPLRGFTTHRRLCVPEQQRP